MRRPQFTLRPLLVAMLVVAAFFAGVAWQKQWMIADGWTKSPAVVSRFLLMGRPDPGERIGGERLELSDGSQWKRVLPNQAKGK